MIDIFFCSASFKGTLRGAMASLCYRRWKQEQEGHIYWMSPGEEPEQWQRERRIHANNRATSEIYVLTDDDCFLQPEPVVSKALEVMGKYPEYGILSLWPSNSTLQRWTPSDAEKVHCCVNYTVHEDSEVMEHVSVGGVRFCRKSALVNWPEMAKGVKSYDSQQCAALREAGFRAGYFKNLFMNHLGRGYSTVWP